MHPMPNEDSVEVEDIDTESDYKCKHCGYEWSENKIKEKVVK